MSGLCFILILNLSRLKSLSLPAFPSGDPRYEVVVDRQEEGLRNVLVIHDADTHDFGAYNCSVVNEYGVARKQIRLNEESECSPETDAPASSS